MPVPKFINKQWTSQMAQIAPHLESFQQRLSVVSEDIRTLEKYLTDVGFRTVATVKSPNGFALSWTDTPNNTWRLCYLSTQLTRPLIEMSVRERLAGAELVPQFLGELARVAALAGPANIQNPSSAEDDVPF